ncbi:ATP synthase-coupling factor 6, mitochondrial isoform X2 [Coregonus clupeaformis]|uniref:ATP synthase-coupling factor 6, mitochondrial isoform X2 n=1 Tax=Coregonus clupeaformis TaxID=59861 RepID=UPI001BE0D36A|nr:ATP synthase-coupling factor 6, mitochondrial isoform X2 [Coregonus clupeaformis]
MAASFLRIGRDSSFKCLQLENWSTLRKAPAAAFSTKSKEPKIPPRRTHITQLDPVQRLFLDNICEYSTRSKASGGLVDAGPKYEKALSEEKAKLQRLYGGGDLTEFPDFKFPEPKLDDWSAK